MHKGSCLCGLVQITVDSELKGPNACHCNQCRKQTGHFLASVDVKRDHLKVAGHEYVTWYKSSDKAQRGFCSQCGSTLFWDPLKGDWTSVAMGVFDKPTSAKLTKHIYVADKGDYYEIADGLPQNQQ